MPHKGNVGFELRRINNLMARRMGVFHDSLKAEGITVMHNWIIGFVAAHDGQDVYQKDVEAEFSLSRSTATNILQLMEKKGFITREPVEWDARLKKIVLTDRGREIQTRADRVIDGMERQLVKGIDPEELRCFSETLRKLRKNMEEMYGGPPARPPLSAP